MPTDTDEARLLTAMYSCEQRLDRTFTDEEIINGTIASLLTNQDFDSARVSNFLLTIASLRSHTRRQLQKRVFPLRVLQGTT